jgi:hypothetical protein
MREYVGGCAEFRIVGGWGSMWEDVLSLELWEDVGRCAEFRNVS